MLESNETLSKEVNVFENRTVVKCVPSLVASGTWATGVKVLVGCNSIDTAISKGTKAFKA